MPESPQEQTTALIEIDCPVCHVTRTIRRRNAASPTFTGLCVRCSTRLTGQKQKGQHHYLWCGDDAGYRAVHAWLRRNFTKPDHCEKCGKTGCNLHWSNISGKYLRKREDYEVLCVSCHFIKDRRAFYCPHGHPYSLENTYTNPTNGAIACRICKRESTRRSAVKARCA